MKKRLVIDGSTFNKGEQIIPDDVDPYLKPLYRYDWKKECWLFMLYNPPLEMRAR